MRLKLLFVLMLVSLSFSMTELAFSVDTAKMGDDITLSGKFTAPGDTVDVKVFLDRDADKVFTENTDLLIFDSKEEKEPFIDGSDFMDTLADGLLNLQMKAGGDGPFMFPGDYVWVFDDKGKMDTLSIVILPMDNPTHFVKGTVTSPDGPVKDLMVWAHLRMDMSREGNEENEMKQVSTITLSDGTYQLPLPAEWKGQKLEIGTWDDFDVLEGKAYLPPAPVEILFDKDTLMQDFEFKTATQFVKVQIIDEEQKPIPDIEFHLWMETEEGGSGSGIHGETDSMGYAVVPITTGKWGIGIDDWDPEAKKFLVPHTKIEVLETDDTVMVTFPVYTTNSSIYVKVDNQTTVMLDDRNFGFNISVKPANSEIEYYGYYQYRGETEFEMASTTLLTNYNFHYWKNHEIVDIDIKVEPNQNINSGDTVYITVMEKVADKVIKGTVTDEAGLPLAGISLTLHNEDGSQNEMGIDVTTDENGIFIAPIYPGKWNIHYYDKDSSGKSYMVPHMRIEVTESSDTTMVDYKMVTADASVTVNIFNLTGLTFDEHDYGVEIFYDAGEDMKLVSLAKMVDDTTLLFPVSSTMGTYKMHSWFNYEKYPNVFITPSYLDTVKVNDVIRVEITSPTQILKVTVTDEANVPIPSKDIIAWSFGEQHIEFEATLDSLGVGYIPIIPGEWEVFVATDEYMNKHHKITIAEGTDTTMYTYVLKKPNAQISGMLVNFSNYKLSDFDDLGIGAEAHPPLDSMHKDSMDEGPMDNYYMRTKINSDGSFTLPVLTTDSMIDGYYVSIEEWNLPHDLAIAPSSKGFMFYPYVNVQPGNDSLYFAMYNIEGHLYGTVELTILDSIKNEYDKTTQRAEGPIGAVITVKEALSGFVNFAEIMHDGKYDIPLPKGTFEVTLSIYLPDTTITQKIEALVMDGGDTEVRFTDDGIIITPIIQTQQQMQLSFFAHTIDNTPVITFTTPERADVDIALLDLRGRIVAERSLHNLNAGQYKAEFANQNLASGFYISRIRINSKQGFVKYLKFIIK